MILIAILLACVSGFSISLMITIERITRSNDYGNIEGDFYTSCPLHMINKADYHSNPYHHWYLK